MSYKFCPKCGIKLDREYKFCPECGYALNMQASAKNTEPTPGKQGTAGLKFTLVGNTYELTDGKNISTPNVVIPEYFNSTKVTSIGGFAFENCEDLSTIKIPASVTSIGNNAFSFCTSLNKIEIPASVTNIGVCAFFECESLTEIEIPASVTSIGEDAFGYCIDLEAIYVPDSRTAARVKQMVGEDYADLVKIR